MIAENLGNALQLTNILRDLKEDAALQRLYVPLDMLRKHGVATHPTSAIFRDPGFPDVCADLAGIARGYYAEASRLLAQLGWRKMRPAALMMAIYRETLDRPGAARMEPDRRSHPPVAGTQDVPGDPLRPALAASTLARTHVVGAGLAGLAAAVSLARHGHAVTLYEGSGQAGGRCRSYVDTKLACTIDNGNHPAALRQSGGHALPGRHRRLSGTERSPVGALSVS